MANENLKFSFSSGNIKRVPFDKYEKNFTFIVNGKRYETSRFIADLLSPIISNYHFDDETVDEFTITTSQSEQIQENFQEFLTIINKGEIDLNDQQRSQYSEFFLKLGNIDEYFRLSPVKTEDLSPENVIDRLKLIQKVPHSEINENENIQQVIKYASEHFYELPIEKVKTLEIEVIEELIKNGNLRLESEDSLLLFILQLYEKDKTCSILFEYVKFKNLSKEPLTEFMNHFDIQYLNYGTFCSICNSITNEEDKRSERYLAKYISFEHKEGDEFNGIMKYLTDKTNGNIHDNGTIEITANSKRSDSNNYTKNVVDYQSNESFFRFGDDQSPNHEICFDFKDMQIQLSSYSIKSYSWNKNDDHLKSWKIEVSNDGKEWEKIDEHNNSNQLNGPNVYATFDTQKTKSFYRFVRLTQTGPCFSGDYHATFVMFEFYGKLAGNYPK